jgi:hypothetical protein
MCLLNFIFICRYLTQESVIFQCYGNILKDLGGPPIERSPSEEHFYLPTERSKIVLL